MLQKLLFTLLCISSTTAFALRIDCTADQVRRRYVSTCRKVLDLTKYRDQHTISYLDCVTGPQDGYESQLCSSVDVDAQRKLQSQIVTK